MIKLYQFPSQWSLPNPSPFCMKLETYLRMAKLPFEAVYVINPGKGPKKKLPTINDDGKILGDRFRFCFVSMNEKGSSFFLQTIDELEARIKNKRIQYQINL